MLAKLFFLFTIQLTPGFDNWIDQNVYFFWEKRNLPVNLRQRVLDIPSSQN